MSQRSAIALVVGLALIAILLVAMLYQSGQSSGDPPVIGEGGAEPVYRPPEPSPRPARPTPREELAVAAPGNQPSAATEPVPADVRKEFNYAMRDAVKEARVQCVNPWLSKLESPPPATFIMDAVVTDGELTDISLRGIGEIPTEVSDCARDAAWAVAWPSWDGKGEVRFQETFTTTGRDEG